MNRTLAVLGLAALLALLAALFGLGDVDPPAQPGPAPGSRPAPAPAGMTEVSGIRLRTQLTHPYVATGTTEAFFVVSLEAADGLPKSRRPVHLALVLDRSASMAGARLRHAREAARRLIHSLSEHDHLAIVHYGSEAVALPSLRADAEGRAQMLAFVDAMEAEGGTNLEEALSLAADALEPRAPALHRVLLISDGQPTAGEVEPEALIGMAETMRRRGLTLDAMGVGEDFNEELLAALARAGDGTYAFLRDGAALPQRVLEHRERAAHAVAEALQVELKPGPHVELLEVLGHPLERHGPTSRVRLPGLAAGETTHFVARVRIHSDGLEDALEIATVGLEVHEAGAGRTNRTQATVSAHRAPNLTAAASYQDASLTPTVVRALVARNTALAADALATYQPTEAVSRLEETRALLNGLVASRADFPSPSADALSLLWEEYEAQEARVRAAAAAGGGLGASGTIKAMRLAARQGFGLQGERP